MVFYNYKVLKKHSVEIIIGYSLKFAAYASQPKYNGVKLDLQKRINAFDSTWQL